MPRQLLIFLVTAGFVLAAAPVAFADNYFEVESARANARAGGPTNERDRELLRKYGALSGTKGFSKSGLHRYDGYHQRKRRHHRDHD